MSFGKSLLCALALSCGVAGTASAASSYETFTFGWLNPPMLSTNCATYGPYARVYVRTNACTNLRLSWGNFYRYETDCNARILTTGGYYADVAQAYLAARYIYDWPCHGSQTPGHRLVPRRLSAGTNYELWDIESHRGGYIFDFRIAPRGFDCDDDAGYYRANATVYVSTLPVRDAVLPAVVCRTQP